MDKPQRPGALLVCFGASGGLGVVTADIARQLAQRGWDVVALVNADAVPFDTVVAVDRQLPPIQAELEHKGALAIPSLPRRMIRDGLGVDRSLLMLLRRGGDYARESSRSLELLERKIAETQADVVLLSCDSLMPPGATALALTSHPRTVILTLTGLARELAAHSWPALRWLARLCAGRALHPHFFRRVTRSQLATVVFASKAWMDQGLAAGVPSESARVIYHGVPIGPLFPRHPLRHRLLWVARLSPEKGLHIVLPALPSVIQAYPATRLTVVAGDGPGWYRAEIERLLDRLHLRGAVDLVPAVPRDALATYYADHDLLLFSSQNAEPVALVTLEAFASGIPVVSSRPRTDSPLIQDGVTCLTYDPSLTDSVASAICRMLGDESLRCLLAQNARDLAVSDFSLEAMGRQYDDYLRELLLR